MSAREEVLRSIRARKPAVPVRAAVFERTTEDNPVRQFVAGATAANASVHVLNTINDVPNCISELLRARNLAATVHLPSDETLEGLEWSRLSVSHNLPGPDDTAISVAAFGVAETGTLVFPARIDRPASWHFRPGLEIAVLRADDILPDLETAFAKLREKDWQHTINLVTGPSRTGDIEQTMELGAHGPKALAILLIEKPPAI